MLRCLILFYFVFSFFSSQSQDVDCYDRLLLRGMEEFNKGNYKLAILKWQTAKDNCPKVTPKEKMNLDAWISKAQEKAKNNTIDSAKSINGYRVVIKRDTVIKTIVKKDTVFIRKKDTIYITKPVERIVYVDKPIEKIVYRERPEPYHPYGKGKCKILIFTSCSSGGVTNVWIDGEFIGSFHVYMPTGEPDCDDKDFVSVITITGKHHVFVRDNSNQTWDFYITVAEDECQKRHLVCN